MDDDELSVIRILREFYYYERKGGRPYYTVLSNPLVSLSLHKVHSNSTYRATVTVKGFNADYGFSPDKKQAVQISLRNLLCKVQYTQGGAYFMSTTTLSDNVVNSCPPRLKASIRMPHSISFKVSHPTALPRLVGVTMAQEQFRELLPPSMLREVDRFEHTYDCGQDEIAMERLTKGALVNASVMTDSRVTMQDVIALNNYYLDNFAPKNEHGELLTKVVKKPEPRDLFNLRMNNGACAPLLFYDDGVPGKKYDKMASLIMSTMKFVECGKDAPIATSRIFPKAETEAKVKEDGTPKKIRFIQNSAPESVMLTTYLWDVYMQLTTGVLFGDMIGVSTAHSYITDILRYWHFSLHSIWEKKGITNYIEFLDEIDRRGADCSDQSSWEATTEEKTALHLIFQLVSSLEPKSFQREKEWIMSLLANFLKPHAVLSQRGSRATVITKMGATESGNKLTLWGNTKRHAAMTKLFAIKARKVYKEGGRKLDNITLPDLDDWEDELTIFEVCENIMGDDRLALHTAYSSVFHKWKDFYFGTITKQKITKDFFCVFDENGVPKNDCAIYLQTHFTRRTPSVLRCEKSALRIYCKFLPKPFQKAEHAIASCQMAMFNVCQEGYPMLKKLHDLLIVNLSEDRDSLQRKLEKFWESDEEFNLYDKPTLAPPPPAIVDAYKLHLKSGDLPARIYSFKMTANDPHNYEKLKM